MIWPALVTAGVALAGVDSLERELPSITTDMLDRTAVACIMIGDDGRVSGAFLIASSGDRSVDQHIPAYARRFRWGRRRMTTLLPDSKNWSSVLRPER